MTTIPWYAGWGLRYSRGGLLYCVWGRRAVRLALADGRSFTVGTDEPGAAAGDDRRGSRRSRRLRPPPP